MVDKIFIYRHKKPAQWRAATLVYTLLFTKTS